LPIDGLRTTGGPKWLLIPDFCRFILAGMKNQQPKIELRKDVPRPYWRLRLFVPTPTGLRRRNFDLGFRDETTRKQANKKRLELLAKVNKGELHDSGGMKFSALVASFRELRLSSLKASTQALYQQHLEHHLIPGFGDYELEQINRLRIEEFLATKSSLSWWSRRGILTVLSTVLGAAVEWHALDHNAALGITLPKKTEKNAKVHSVCRAVAVACSVSGRQYWHAGAVACGHGLARR